MTPEYCVDAYVANNYSTANDHYGDVKENTISTNYSGYYHNENAGKTDNANHILTDIK